MKKAIVFIGSAGVLGVAFLMVIFLAANRPAGDKEALAAADNLLTAGHLNEAIALYEQLAGQGQESSALYFNLGNAYYRQGNLTAAQNAYQQAAALAPRDADIDHNLTLVEQELGVSQPAGTLLDRFNPGWLAANEIALLTLAAWYGVSILLLFVRLMKKSGGWQTAN